MGFNNISAFAEPFMFLGQKKSINILQPLSQKQAVSQV